MSIARGRVLAGSAAFWLVAGLAASAQPVAVFRAPDAPIVLHVDPDGRVIPPPGRTDLVAPAIPVPQVMNGAGYGPSGVDYYFDEPTEGRLGSAKRPRDYVLAPALVGPIGPYGPRR